MPAKKRCFVISPNGAPGCDVRAHADDVFNYILEPVTTQMGYETERGDHAARPGRISDQMYDRILHDELLIAVYLPESERLLRARHRARRGAASDHPVRDESG